MKCQNVIIVKTRDDKEPVYLEEMPDGQDMKFKSEKSQCSWINSSGISLSDLRSRIEPWLTALFQSEHFSLLVGTGLTHAVHSLTKDGQSLKVPSFKSRDFQTQICPKKNKKKDESNSTADIENQLQIANEISTGLKHLNECEEKVNNLDEEISTFLDEFSKYILGLEKGILLDESDRDKAFKYLMSFLMSFASRFGTRDRLHIFTTNYDRLIEEGAEIAGLRLIDRFVGSLFPIFRSTRLNIDMHYNPPGIRGEPRYLEGIARFTKLHGSVDWVQSGTDIRRIGLPFGVEDIKPFLNALGIQENVFNKLMIYPNAAKDRETANYPYVELFRDFAAAVCRPNSCLITYGYSFGDEHINRVIKDMLTIPSAHLVVISFNDPNGDIMKTYEELEHSAAQITLLIGKPFGDLEKLVKNYLPKPAIDSVTARMTKLLQSRYARDLNDHDVKNSSQPLDQ